MLAAILASAISVLVQPQTCFSPCTVRVTVKVEQAGATDRVDVIIQGAEIMSSQVNIEEGRRTYQLKDYVLRGGGDWLITVVLYRRGQKPQEATAQVLVVGG